MASCEHEPYTEAMGRRIGGAVLVALLAACSGATTGTGTSGEGGVDGAGGSSGGGGGSSGAGSSGSASGSSGAGSSGASVDAGTACTNSAGCAANEICGFPTAQGCSARGTCFPAPGVTCLAFAAGCACNDAVINITCTGLPSGYVAQPLLNPGACIQPEGGTGCTFDSQCYPGLKCCYPCGIPGCSNACVTPQADGSCPLYP
jgi:hypothetical protein